MSLILASNSEIRRHMLVQADIEHCVIAPDFDEDSIKQAHLGDAETLCRRLAEGKALSVSSEADDWVIGSDSVVSVDGKLYSKPIDRPQARAHLAAFSGRTMVLSSGVALSQGGRIDWTHAETARLPVRELSSEFIEAYLDAEWPAIGHCAGAFRMEGRGVTLFTSVEGDHFTILGMPLLPLLGALRDRGVLPS